MNSKLLYIVVLFVFSINLHSQKSSTKLIASCCESKVGRCTGSAYCTACTNCSRCAHCSNGGSCGVCSSSNDYTPIKKKGYKKSRKTSSSFKSYGITSRVSYYKDQTLSVIAKTVNVRKGPGMSYDILETLKNGDYVYFKQVSGDWALVEVHGSDIEGYVFLKYLN